MATGYNSNREYSKSPEVIHGMAIQDIRENGFKVVCIATGIQFFILPGDSICRGITKSLEREWFGIYKT